MKNKDKAEVIEIKYCKGKNCHKQLPLGYKHNYCEACRIQHAQVAKNAGKGLGAVLSLALAVFTGGKIKLNK